MKINVEIATSIKYGNYKAYQSAANELERFIDNATEHLGSMLTLPKFLTIKIRPIKGLTRGFFRFNDFDSWIELDPRYSLRTIIDTLMHELVHCEQYTTGKLEFVNGGYKWMGARYQEAKPSVNYTRYRDLPWEEEAFTRQSVLAAEIINRIVSGKK